MTAGYGHARVPAKYTRLARLRRLGEIVHAGRLSLYVVDAYKPSLLLKEGRSESCQLRLRLCQMPLVVLGRGYLKLFFETLPEIRRTFKADQISRFSHRVPGF